MFIVKLLGAILHNQVCIHTWRTTHTNRVSHTMKNTKSNHKWKCFFFFFFRHYIVIVVFVIVIILGNCLCCSVIEISIFKVFYTQALVRRFVYGRSRKIKEREKINEKEEDAMQRLKCHIWVWVSLRLHHIDWNCIILASYVRRSMHKRRMRAQNWFTILKINLKNSLYLFKSSYLIRLRFLFLFGFKSCMSYVFCKHGNF